MIDLLANLALRQLALACAALLVCGSFVPGIAQVTVPDAEPPPGVIHPIGNAEDLKAAILHPRYRVPDVRFQTNDFRLPADLSWEVVTNWTTVFTRGATNILGVYWGNAGAEPGIEKGSVCSNLVASLVWKGKTNTLVLESIPFTNLTRSYTYEYRRVYRD